RRMDNLPSTEWKWPIEWPFESVSFVEALFLLQLLYCVLLFLYHNRKTIIQDFMKTESEFTETSEQHVCPTSDVIFSLTHEDARKVWVTGSFLNWDTLVEMQRDPRKPKEWRVRMSLPHGHHQFRFVVDGFWFLRDGVALECDDKGDLCHQMHLPIDARRRQLERLQQSKRRAKWNLEKGEFTAAKTSRWYR
ncbi:hypothetical protein PFISCL1PPCAC_11506, partial [Pristionchus fissidentatus]